MADVFISYSRADQAFVRRLHASLAEQSIEAWVDWQDIPITAKWRAEIRAAIEAADSFVFVLSPDSVGSDICREELEHAESQSKRIAPVVCRGVPTDAVPEGVSSINWLSMESHVDFDRAVSTLVAALATDLAYVRTHTRLLVRAREWEEKEHDASFLLRGQDLQEAELWIADRGRKEPAPSQSHTGYLLASRRSARARQRLLLGSISIALVIAISLALLAFLQRERAIDQAEIARSRELAALAEAARAKDPENGLLLAIEAVRSRPTEQAVSALRQLMSTSRLRALMRGHDASIASASFSADGRHVLSGAYDNTVRLWDAMTGEELRRWNGHTSTIDAVSISRDGQTFASASRDGTVKVWRRERDEPIATMEATASAGTNWMTHAVLDDDGTTLTTVADRQHVKVWNIEAGVLLQSVQLDMGSEVIGHYPVSDGLLMAIAQFGPTPVVHLWHARHNKVVASLTGHQARPNRALFDSGGRVVLTAGSENAAWLWDVASGREITRFDGHEFGVRVAALSADGRLVATNGANASVQLWDARTGQRLRVVRGHTNAVNAAAFSPDGTQLVTAGQDSSARLWDTRTGEPTAVFRGHGDSVTTVQFSADGALVLSGSNDNSLRTWNAKPDTGRALRRGASDSLNPERAPRLSRDGRLVAAWNADGSFEVEDLQAGKTVFKRSSADAPEAASFSPSQARLLTVDEDNRISVWDLVNGERLASVEVGDVAIQAVALAEQQGLIAAAAGDGSIRVRRADGSGELVVLRGHTSAATGVDFNPNERLIATSAWDRTVRIWDRETARALLVLKMDQQPDGVAFSAKGDQIAAWSRGNLTRVWRLEDGSEVTTLRGHTDWVHRAAFSADGQILATASADGTLQIWEARTGRSLTTLSSSFGPFSDVVLLETSVLGASYSGAVVTFPCAVCGDADELVTNACRSVTRNLSHDEWRQSFDATPYRKTCSAAPVHRSVVDTAFKKARQGALDEANDQLESIARIDPGAVGDLDETAQELAAEWSFNQALRHLADGQAELAMAGLEEFERTYPQFPVTAEIWNNVCWSGALANQAEAIMPACDRAVEDIEEDDAGPAHDSRGVARALLGDREGAIEDFIAFLEWAEDEGLDEEQVALRSHWLAELRRGRNPVNAVILKKLTYE